MPSTNNQALLLDLEVFLANNNIRRGILSVAVNVASPSIQTLEASLEIPPTITKILTSVVNNVCTIIRTTKPVRVIVLKGAQTFTFVINSLFVFTDSFDSIEFTNESLTDTCVVRLIQI